MSIKDTPSYASNFLPDAGAPSVFLLTLIHLVRGWADWGCSVWPMAWATPAVMTSTLSRGVTLTMRGSMSGPGETQTVTTLSSALINIGREAECGQCVCPLSGLWACLILMQTPTTTSLLRRTVGKLVRQKWNRSICIFTKPYKDILHIM